MLAEAEATARADEARGRGVRRRQAGAVRDRAAQDPGGFPVGVQGARQDPRPGRGRVATSSGRPVDGRRAGVRRSRRARRTARDANCSTRRSRDLGGDRRARSGRPAGQLPTGPRRGPVDELGTELARVRDEVAVEADLLLEGLVEGILVSGTLRGHDGAAVRPVPRGFRAALRGRRARDVRARARRGHRRLPARPRGPDRARPDGARRDRGRTALLAAVHSPTARACAPSAAATATWASAPGPPRAPTRAGQGSSSSCQQMDQN